jgi:chromosome segregation ATPase
MISAEQIQQIVAENESLQAEVLELNEILVIREEEIAELKKNASSDTELRSMMDLQLDELHLMQNRIGKHQRQAEGAEERELELYHELAQVTKLQQQYSELFQQYTYTIAQLEDIQAELAKVKKRNNMLQQIAVKIGELESNFENLTEERETLKNKVDTLEKLQKT